MTKRRDKANLHGSLSRTNSRAIQRRIGKSFLRWCTEPVDTSTTEPKSRTSTPPSRNAKCVVSHQWPRFGVSFPSTVRFKICFVSVVTTSKLSTIAFFETGLLLSGKGRRVDAEGKRFQPPLGQEPTRAHYDTAVLEHYAVSAVASRMSLVGPAPAVAWLVLWNCRPMTHSDPKIPLLLQSFYSSSGQATTFKVLSS